MVNLFIYNTKNKIKNNLIFHIFRIFNKHSKDNQLMTVLGMDLSAGTLFNFL